MFPIKSKPFCEFQIYMFFSWPHPAVYVGSQARGPIGAIAAGLSQSHSNVGSEHICNLHHSSWQCWIINPLSKGKDRTRNLMVPSQIR